MLDDFRDDERAAISVNIAIFFATVIAGFLLGVVFEPAALPMLDAAAKHTSTQAATDGQQYVRQAWKSVNIIVIGLGAMQLIVAAVYRQRGVA